MIAELLSGTGATPEKALDAVSRQLTQLQDMRYEVHHISEPTMAFNGRASSAREAWTASVSIQRGREPRFVPNP